MAGLAAESNWVEVGCLRALTHSSLQDSTRSTGETVGGEETSTGETGGVAETTDARGVEELAMWTDASVVGGLVGRVLAGETLVDCGA